MSELKITIDAPEIAKAILELAHSIRCKCNCENAQNENNATVTPENPVSLTPATPTPVNPVNVAPVTPPPVNVAPTVVPTAAPTYTLDMLARAGTALVDAGKMPELMALLNKFGVEALTSLKPETYGAVAAELRALGAQI